MKSPSQLHGSGSSEFHRKTTNKIGSKIKSSKSSDLSKHIKSLSTVLYSTSTKKNAVEKDKKDANSKSFAFKSAKSSRSLNGNNVYNPAYHMKLSMVQL